jgi:hypothetical protein
MAGLKILLPYNFAPYEEKALDFAIAAFSDQEDTKITLFNAYTPLPVIDMDANPEVAKMRGAMASLSEELREKEEGLKSARQHLIDNGFSEEQVDYIFKEKEKSVYEEIVDEVRKGHFRVLLLARQPGKVGRLFGRSIHTKVLSTIKDLTVCITT